MVGDDVDDITHSSGRPSLQLLASMDLGNGSSQVCDGSPVNPPGGVPGFAPPIIDCDDPDLTPAQQLACQSQESEVTDALVDVACRFAFVTSEGNACTKNPFGDFAFLADNTTRQYCFQIPTDSQLPAGETVLKVQARDGAGFLGPASEIVIRVP